MRHELSPKPCHGHGWPGLVRLYSAGALMLWSQLIFFAVISLNLRGSQGLASDATIL